ncbi:hypothetical protein K2173_001384 [Erythroxylum novogranatense]|uniref:Uncharacterized protein n=1 Tax=Erythroxylum novogranatense TaxID=1862640 RepID=A0AAV8T504_9ROSI|nr:hypothetical protein K2173_001384 [Erythroxylum novogranatense]
MGHGVSSGSDQSSLGYLFRNGEAPAPAANKAPVTLSENQTRVDIAKQIPAGINNTSSNNYFHIHSAPGGGSSPGYLFGGGSN